MATLHWEMRGMLKEMREEGRLAVLTALILHANIRMRCWPSVPLLINETGWSSASVTAAKVWLIEHGAIVLVPYRKRVDEECRLPRSKHIYQLTGMMNIGGETKPYLYMTPESEQAIKVVLADFLLAEKSVAENSVGKNKGSSTSKGDSTLKGIPKTTSSDVVVERPEIFSVYEQNIGLLTPMIVDSLRDLVKDHTEAWVTDAIKEAVSRGARNLKYIEAILSNWRANGRDSKKPVGNGKQQSAAAPAAQPAPAPKNEALEAAIAEELAKLPDTPPADYQPAAEAKWREMTWKMTGRRNIAKQRAQERLGASA